jgi:hypothetical protein
VTGATQTIERPAKIVALGPHAWLEPNQELTVRVEVEPLPPPAPEPPRRRSR